jgi:hypothetical protein
MLLYPETPWNKLPCDCEGEIPAESEPVSVSEVSLSPRSELEYSEPGLSVVGWDFGMLREEAYLAPVSAVQEDDSLRQNLRWLLGPLRLLAKHCWNLRIPVYWSRGARSNSLTMTGTAFSRCRFSRCRSLESPLFAGHECWTKVTVSRSRSSWWSTRDPNPNLYYDLLEEGRCFARQKRVLSFDYLVICKTGNKIVLFTTIYYLCTYITMVFLHSDE